MSRALLGEVASAVEPVPVDVGGGSSVEKGYLLAWLIRSFRLRMTVDVGVYRGRSLIPQALAARAVGGIAYGVDPYSLAAARQHDDHGLDDVLREFEWSTDFDQVHDETAELISALGLRDSCRLVRETSAEAAARFAAEGKRFDLVHVDGNHDARHVEEDVRLYAEALLRPRGFIVLDDVSWSSVRPVYERLRRRYGVAYEHAGGPFDDYAVLWTGPRPGTLALRAVLTLLARRAQRAT